MSIILRLIEEKNNQLLDIEAKKEERDSILKRLEELNKEITGAENTQILAEIDELTDCAIKLGLMPAPDTASVIVQE